MADSRNQSADKCGKRTMFVEISFSVAHFGFINKAYMPETAVGKLIDDRASQPLCQKIVNQCSDIGSDGSEQNHQIDIKLVVDL